jgi:hypothetical protein
MVGGLTVQLGAESCHQRLIVCQIHQINLLWGSKSPLKGFESCMTQGGLVYHGVSSLLHKLLQGSRLLLEIELSHAVCSVK